MAIEVTMRFEFKKELNVQKLSETVPNYASVILKGLDKHDLRYMSEFWVREVPDENTN